MPTISILFQVIVYHGPRNRLRIGNLIGVESIRIQIDVINRNTVRGYHLRIQIGKKSTLLLELELNYLSIEPVRSFVSIKINSPQIFSGASNSNRIGCDKNISRDLRHRFRMSTSLS